MQIEKSTSIKQNYIRILVLHKPNLFFVTSKPIFGRCREKKM